MSSYIFESVELGKKHPAKVFVTSIEKSSFHCHHEYEFILVLKGSLILSTSPKHTELEAGDIALVNTNAVHELKKTKTENICLFVQINPSLFSSSQKNNSIYLFYLNSKSSQMKPRKDYRHFASLLAQIGLSFEHSDMASFHRTRALLYTLIADLFAYTHYDIHQLSQNVQRQDNAELLMKVVEYIQMNLNKENLAEDLYHELGMSQKTMYRFLKSNVGLSLKEIIDANRIEAAKMALKLSNKSISHIAEDCGFGSENTFYRIFRQETGTTPLEYRKSGSQLDTSPEVKGYLNYNQVESENLMKKLV